MLGDHGVGEVPSDASPDDGTVDRLSHTTLQFIESLCLITTFRSITTDALCSRQLQSLLPGSDRRGVLNLRGLRLATSHRVRVASVVVSDMENTELRPVVQYFFSYVSSRCTEQCEACHTPR